VLDAHRQAVAEAAVRLAARGLVEGTAGNLSAREGDRVAVTPTGADLADLTAAMVPVVDLDGALVEGELEPSSELSLHLGLYRRGDAGAVVHTHAPMATALACVVDELPLVHYSMLDLGGAVRVAPYATFGTEELAGAVAEALEGRSAALMRNHGAVSLGPDLESAVAMTELLEWNCGLYWRARAIGQPLTLDEEQMQDVAATVAERGYGSTHRVEGSGD
jgi:L-fuculose-phosphate aldolase